jgi:hypothetical protein
MSMGLPLLTADTLWSCFERRYVIHAVAAEWPRSTTRQRDRQRQSRDKWQEPADND